MGTDMDDPIDPRLADALGRLRDTPPAADLWPEIAPRLVRRLPRGSVLLRWPTAIAAGLLIAVASGAGTALLLDRGNVTPPAADVASGTLPATSVVTVAETSADAALQRAIQDLEGVFDHAAASLAPETRAGIRESLTALDRAINDAAAQQRAIPTDPRLARYLTSVLQRKLEVLQQVTQRTMIRT